MHKTNGNMSGQHRKENVGRTIWIETEVSKQFDKLRKLKVTSMTDEQLQVWLSDCLANENMWGGIPHRQKPRWVKLRKQAETEISRRKARK